MPPLTSEESISEAARHLLTFSSLYSPDKIHHLCHGIFEETGLHAGCADAADLFLIYQDTACGVRSV